MECKLYACLLRSGLFAAVRKRVRSKKARIDGLENALAATMKAVARLRVLVSDRISIDLENNSAAGPCPVHSGYSEREGAVGGEVGTPSQQVLSPQMIANCLIGEGAVGIHNKDYLREEVSGKRSSCFSLL